MTPVKMLITPVTTIIKITKYIDIIFKKDIPDLYGRNTNVLCKDIKEYLNKWENIECNFWLNNTYYNDIISQQTSLRFNAISLKIPLMCSIELDKLTLIYT